MAADIVEAAYGAFLIPQDQGALADNVHGDVIAGVRKVGDMAGDLPVLAEDMLFFQLQKGVAMIAPAGQAASVPVIGNADVSGHFVHEFPHILLNVHSI